MEFKLKAGEPEGLRSGCLIIGVWADQSLTPAAQRIDQASGGQVKKRLKSGDINGKLGETLVLHGVQGVTADRLLLVGCGPVDDLNDRNFRKITQHAIGAVKKTGAKDALSFLTELQPAGRDLRWKAVQTVLLARDAIYTFNQLKKDGNGKKTTLAKLTLAVQARAEMSAGNKALKQAQAIANGIHLAKDLANLPGNYCTPSYLGEQALALQKTHASLKVQVLNQVHMEKLKMGALLSVARGSRQEPKFIILDYQGGKAKEPPIVLVGKGITFDSGGISIKPSAAMDEMKYDMCGAASVLGTLACVAELSIPLNVVGLVPTCENMPDGNANKPGDIVSSMSGQTIEVLNTDAEGRLILCDALTYAERYKPKAVVDIATLTGACVVALGKHASGLLSNQQALADELIAAGEAVADRAWQLPLWDEYQQQLKSNFADMANIGGRDAGTVTAACFLSRFTKQFDWAHLDIAGTAWRSGKDKGATGRPVSLLVEYLLRQC